MGKNKFKINIKSLIKYFVIIFLILFTLVFTSLFFIEKEIRTSKFEEIKKSEENLVKLENDLLDKEFRMIIGDLTYLYDAFKFQLDNPENYEEIALNWENFSSKRNIYDQIRYIDLAGDEKIRINLNGKDVEIIPDEELQNKKDRYYFYETIELDEGTIHISPMDLNIELDEVEEPKKPMIRFSTAVYDENGQVQGVMILNYLAKELLENFKELAENSRGEVVLLNSESYWLSSPDPNLEWSFMYDDLENVKFKDRYRKEWEAIIKQEPQIITSKGLFTTSIVDIGDLMTDDKEEFSKNIYLKDRNAYIVSSVMRQGENESVFVDNNSLIARDVIKNNIIYFIFLILLAMIISILY